MSGDHDPKPLAIALSGLYTLRSFIMATSPSDRTQAALEKLEAGLEQLLHSDQWAEHLKAQSRFHSYSFNNCLLIAMQYPEATQIAGFNAWKKLGRSVSKGEKAIWILAPLRYKREEEDPETGEAIEHLGVRGFKTVPVFDLAQTEGEPLATAPVGPLTGDDQGLFEALKQFSEQRGWLVKLEPLNGPNGVCRFRSHDIGVDSMLSPIHRAKTLAHEIAHSLLHDPSQYKEHRGDMELEAESTAFVVLDHFGLDSGDYSFGYVAHWQQDNDAITQLKQVGQRIQSAAKQVIDALEADQAGLELLKVA